MLCRAVTGEGFSKRELFSDASDIVFTFRRSIIMTGRYLPTDASDFLDRCLLSHRERLAPDERAREVVLWEAFTAGLSALVGAVLDALAETIRVAPTVSLKRSDRMADFHYWATAATRVLRYSPKVFSNAMVHNAQRRVEESLESDILGPVLQKWSPANNKWEGTATELLKLLTGLQGNRPPKEWPKAPNALTRRLRKLRATLDEIGVRVTFGRASETGERRIVVVRFDPTTLKYRKTSSVSSGSSQTKNTKASRGDGLSQGLSKTASISSVPPGRSPEGDTTEAKGTDDIHAGPDDPPKTPSGLEPASTKGCDDTDDTDDICPHSQEGGVAGSAGVKAGVPGGQMPLSQDPDAGGFYLGIDPGEGPHDR
jgi:hypothetical protein